MTRWACGIGDCTTQFDAVGDLIVHQATDHRECECEICGASVPEGYLAIRHAFEEHKRADFVRAYDACSDDIRERETLVEEIEGQVDVDAVLARLEAAGERQPVSAD